MKGRKKRSEEERREERSLILVTLPWMTKRKLPYFVIKNFQKNLKNLLVFLFHFFECPLRLLGLFSCLLFVCLSEKKKRNDLLSFHEFGLIFFWWSKESGSGSHELATPVLVFPRVFLFFQFFWPSKHKKKKTNGSNDLLRKCWKPLQQQV